MKKVLLALSLSAIFVSIANAQTTFGIHANVISANQTWTEEGISLSPGSRISWKAGIIANIPVATNLSFMPQLNLLNKGSKWEFETESSELKLTYLELPLNFAYNSGGFFGGIGPVVSFGISGSSVDKDGTDEYTTDIKFDGKENATSTDDYLHLKGLEVGGNIFAGYKLTSGLFFNASYNFGLSNISPDSGGSIKNSYFGFGVGYFFGGGTK